MNRGFYFDGRLAESFKLSTGTWVSVGAIRAALIDHCAPYIQDVVIAGADREHIAALIFPSVENCRRLIGRLEAGLSDLATDRNVRQHFARLLTSFHDGATGSSNRVVRATLLADAPSIDNGEMTDKGTLNQRAVLRIAPASSKPFMSTAKATFSSCSRTPL